MNKFWLWDVYFFIIIFTISLLKLILQLLNFLLLGSKSLEQLGNREHKLV